MNFEERDSHWESFLQDKANLSQSFIRDSCCKVCLCLELLKISVCNDSCYTPQENTDLVERLLQGVLDPDTFTLITEKLSSHLKNILFVSGFQEKLEEMELSLKKYNQKIIDLDVSAHLEKLKKVDRALDSNKIEMLAKRIDNYEETLLNLRTENEELRQQLKKAINTYEDYKNSNRKSANEIRVEFEFIREEQTKIRGLIESYTKSVAENVQILKELKSKDNIKDDTDIKAFRLQLIEEYKGIMEKIQGEVKKNQENCSESEKKIDEVWSQIQDLKKEQEKIVIKHKECKDSSVHANHLLTASDSVYSSLQQLQDLTSLVQEKLEKLQKDIDSKVPEKKNLVIEEFSHPGVYDFDQEKQKSVWSCCKNPIYESKGCQRKFYINENM